MKVWLPCLLACLLLANLPLLGQERFSDLTGVATDSSGAVLPNVTVTITNRASSRVLTTKTGGDGSYVARELEPGRYSVKFELQGFSAFEVPDVILILGKTLKVSAQMQVGSAQQTVQVTEESPLVDLTSTQVSHNVTSEEFDRLPKTRTFQSLALTSPSVNTGEIEGGFQVNGSSGAENQFTVDGISTNSLIDGRSRENAAFEFLQEVQVKTGGIEAEYGGALGGVISAITKSGGNAFHGEGHYYYSGNAVSAGPVNRLLLNPVDDKTVSYVQDTKQQNDRHEIGGSVGGYFIKDRLWFFTSWSPAWNRRTQDYLFSNGKEPGTINQKQLFWQGFNKVSFDPVRRVRTNFTWLYTPTISTGTFPAYNSGINTVTSSLASNLSRNNQGYFAPQTSYTGNVDITLTETTLLSIRGGRFWDDYKDTGIPLTPSVSYQTSAVGLPFAIPAALQQPIGYQNISRNINNFYDLTTRSYVQADLSKFGRFLGTHDLKIGAGVSKTVNKVDQSYPGGFVYLYWDRAFTSSVPGMPPAQRGQYGYYEVDDYGTRGTTGGTITNLYIQDKWRIHPRLTLDLGLRTESENVPSFKRAIQDPAFSFPFTSKMAPRLGASWDVLGDGKLKIYGSYGIFYDWVKYELSRGTFGGQVWNIKYRALDTTDVFNLSWDNAPGRDLWSNGNPSNPYRDRRVPGFNTISKNLKPMSTYMINLGTEYQLNAQTVLGAHYVHNSLRHTIEDLGALVNGNEVYLYGNPGEGETQIMPTSGATTPFQMPKARRTYDAMELTLTRRFSGGWFGSASYVYSRLYGNYSGLGSSDEIRTPTTGVSSSTAQQSGGSIARPGSSASRYYDLDEILWDSKGDLDVEGRLATDRPHVIKLYGSKFFKTGTEVGAMFYGGSGTPLSTYVNTLNQVEVFVNGRGDMGRTPFLTQTDLLVAHEIKFGEVKKLRFEFNAQNVFNQKTSRHSFVDLNRGAGTPRASSAINLSKTDLAKGYDYNAMILSTADGKNAYDPRYGMSDLFNPGFAGRIGIKFIF